MEALNFTLERNLNFEIAGQRSVGKLKVGGIEKCDGAGVGGFWVCYWSLDEIHPNRGRIYGVDALDAFLNCIQFLKVLIARHEELGYRIWWNEAGDEAGLVAPAATKK